MSEQEPNYELMANAHSAALVMTLVRMSLIPLIEVSSIDADPYAHPWVARTEITEAMLEEARMDIVPNSTTAIVMNYYHDRVLGHWVLTGVSEDVSMPHQVESEEAAVEMQAAIEARMWEEYGYGDY